jgi:hypothetical protein
MASRALSKERFVMKKCVKLVREDHALSTAFHHSLNAYALAAGAAGIGLLALAEPSSAEIVYTPMHQVLNQYQFIHLDLNHDGITDVTIQNKYRHYCNSFGSCFAFATLQAVLPGTNEVVYNGYGAVAMKVGVGIGPRDAFKGGSERMALGERSFSHVFGSWVNVSNRYLGVKFNISGETHYGWVRLTVQTQGGLTINATLTGYAYESLPNTPITAGKTEGPVNHAESTDPAAGTLGKLALGRR